MEYYWNQLFAHSLGAWGSSPVWYIIAAAVTTMFLARWAHAIRVLLPFFGAIAGIYVIVWACIHMGIMTLHWPGL